MILSEKPVTFRDHALKKKPRGRAGLEVGHYLKISTAFISAFDALVGLLSDTES